MKKNRQKSAEESQAEYLEFVVNHQSAELLQSTLNSLGLKGQKANELKAKFFDVVAQRLENNGQMGDATDTRKIASNIRALGDKDLSELGPTATLSLMD